MAIHRSEYPIHSYEADQFGVAEPTALFRFLLESASQHADSVGYGYRHMQEQAYTWVLSRFLFAIERYPRWQERVGVETWPSGSERLFALRDYRIVDSSGVGIARATSSWIVINVATRAPERPERVRMLSNHFTDDQRVFERNAAKIPAAAVEASRPEVARYSDIDVNGHVTSARYLEWILDGFAPDFRSSHALEGFEINYLAETLCGEEVRVGQSSQPTREGDPVADRPGAQDSSPSFFHSIERSADRVVLCRARTSFRPRAM